jgi:MoxR-like ATPase
LLVKTLAEALDLTFSRIQFTPDLMPADVVGTNMIVESSGERRFEFQRGPIFANLVLADEINRATPKTQSALLEAMQEQSVTVGKQTYPLSPPFFVLATQNPIEMEGTYPLPEAQLDRFFFKLRVELPGNADLHAILDRTTGATDPVVRAVLGRARLLELRELVRQVPVARPIQDYAVRLIAATHPDRSTEPRVRKVVRYGSSPRGAQAVILAAKIRALSDGRFAPSFDDIRRVAAPALRHRVLLNFEGEAEGVSTDAVLGEILAALPEVT